MRHVLILGLLLTSGCLMRAAGPPRPLSRDEAIDIAVRTAEERGYRDGGISQAQRTDREWRLEYRVVPPLRGSIRIAVDAWNGSLVRFDERVWSEKRHHREHEHDDDEDEGEHGHRGHGDDDD